MAIPNIIYDYDFMSASRVGKFGFKPAELAKLQKKLQQANDKLQADKKQAELSFTRLPFDTQLVSQLTGLAKKLQSKFANMLVIGIGGSDLGAKAIYYALNSYQSKKVKPKNLFFLGDTTDPAPLVDLLQTLDLAKTVIYMVSKSGGTIEPLANFLAVRQALIKKVGYKKHSQHIIVTTSLNHGPLATICQKENYTLLPHVQAGGRFSVLSVNALLPAAYVGLQIADLLAGARQMAKICQSNTWQANSAFTFAALHYLAYTKRQQTISVLMPYSYYLKVFGAWYRQLLAESIGKKYNRLGQQVNIGLTPISALGPADQHSQIQLYNEGPFDKVITFVTVKKFSQQYNLQIPDYPGEETAYLGKQQFLTVLNSEQQATALSLMKNKRPNATLILPELNEFYLGQLFYFMEMATYYLGELFNLNVFDQPGVEQSKNFMSGLLNRPGYEKYRQIIKNI